MNSKLLSVAFALAAFACIGLAAARPSSTPVTLDGPTRPSAERVEIIPDPEPIQTVAEVTIVGKLPAKKRAKKSYRCGQFEPLENDAVQMVRRCEWR